MYWLVGFKLCEAAGPASSLWLATAAVDLPVGLLAQQHCATIVEQNRPRVTLSPSRRNTCAHVRHNLSLPAGQFCHLSHGRVAAADKMQRRKGSLDESQRTSCDRYEIVWKRTGQNLIGRQTLDSLTNLELLTVLLQHLRMRAKSNTLKDRAPVRTKCLHV